MNIHSRVYSLKDHPVHLDAASMATFLHSFSETDKIAYHGTADDDGKLRSRVDPFDARRLKLTPSHSQRLFSASTVSTSRILMILRLDSNSANSRSLAACSRLRFSTLSSVSSLATSGLPPALAELLLPQNKFSNSFRLKSPKSVKLHSMLSSSSEVSPLQNTSTLEYDRLSELSFLSSSDLKIATPRLSEERLGTDSGYEWVEEPSAVSSVRDPTV